MKKVKYLMVALAMVVASAAWAQEEEPEVVKQDPKALAKIQAARIALITERLGLTPEQAEKFWPVYREFALQRNQIRKEVREAQQQIGPDNQDLARQEELVKLGLSMKQRELDLEKTYSTRLLKIITAKQILSLRSAETDFNRMIIQQLQQRRIMQQRKEQIRERNQDLKQKRN